MKQNIVIIISFLAIMVSCDNGMEVNQESLTGNPNKENTFEQRSYDEALSAAYNAIGCFQGDYLTRNKSKRDFDLSHGVKYIIDNKSFTRSSNSSVDTLMYIFNFEDEQGFVIISANKKTIPLIAITESGHYDPSEEQDNKGFQLLMENTKKYIKDPDVEGNDRFEPFTPYYEDDNIYTILQQVGNFVHVRWGQEDPEGLHCPNGACGCTITAMAMLISYGLPTSINLTYEGAPVSNTTLDWDLMRLHNRNHSYGEIEFFDNNIDRMIAHKMITYLCRQLGNVAGSNYSGYNTITPNANIPSTFSYYGYCCSAITSFNSSTIINILNQGHPVYMIGYTSNGQGHCWLVDGYQYCKVENTMTGNVSYHYYNHINWGWDGQNNGYFISNSFNTIGTRYDGIYNSKSYNFTDIFELLHAYPQSN